MLVVGCGRENGPRLLVDGVLIGVLEATSRLSEEGIATTLPMYMNNIYIKKKLEKIISCNNFSDLCVRQMSVCW